MPVASGKPAEESVREAHHPLPRVQAAMRAMWGSYRKAAGLDAADATAVLQRASAYCAARLIQTAYEYSQQAPTLSNHAVTMLQVAANVLRDPEAALLDLFGIPAPLLAPARSAARPT
jgi:hypothetical protein